MFPRISLLALQAAATAPGCGFLTDVCSFLSFPFPFTALPRSYSQCQTAFPSDPSFEAIFAHHGICLLHIPFGDKW